jgi:hypothetical protein
MLLGGHVISQAHFCFGASSLVIWGLQVLRGLNKICFRIYAVKLIWLFMADLSLLRARAMQCGVHDNGNVLFPAIWSRLI